MSGSHTGLCIRVIVTIKFTMRFTKYHTQSCSTFSSSNFETFRDIVLGWPMIVAAKCQGVIQKSMVHIVNN